MKKLTLTSKLNFEIVAVVLLLLISLTAYHHWLSLQTKTEKSITRLTAITEYLVNKKPVGTFAEIVMKQGDDSLSIEKQIMAINQELQPILDNTLITNDIIKFGYYSRQQKSIVAIGPHFDPSLLVETDPRRFQEIYETNQPKIIEKSNSLVWHGDTVVCHVRPIKENGEIIGHAFACIDQTALYAAIWKETLYTFLGAFLMLLVCVAIFRELFTKLKKDLNSFAESMCSGTNPQPYSEIAELTPILSYLSEQTERMTRLDRLNIIGEMAAGIAHEVRNPMTTVRGLLQFLSNKKEFNAYQDEFNLMIEEIDRANSIITEFLSLAKNKTMEFSKHNLNSIIHDIYPLLQADALRNNCELNVTLNEIPAISVDQNSIRQLILNMVRNGLDAMPNGGTISITTDTADSKVVLSIQDTGIGISQEFQKKLGTPFFTTKEQGTGLGLAVCYRIAQRHSATITVNSALGKGTTFLIKFNTAS